MRQHHELVEFGHAMTSGHIPQTLRDLYATTLSCRLLEILKRRYRTGQPLCSHQSDAKGLLPRNHILNG